MTGKESDISRLKKTGSDIRNAPGALSQSAEDSAETALSPFSQKKQEADAALERANAPFEEMRDRQQQAQMSMDAAKQQTESAKKVLDAKELMFGTTGNVSDKTMNDTQSTLSKANQSIEERQKDYQNAGALVKDLIAKIEAQAKGAAGNAGTAPGVNR